MTQPANMSAPESPRVNPHFLLLVRLSLAAIWLFEGLWQKIIAADPHELSIVSSFTSSPQGAHHVLVLIGIGETLLAVGVLSGLFNRFVSWFQFTVLLVMNITGIVFGKGTIASPVSLLLHNLSLFACMALLAMYGPGAFALTLRGRPDRN